MFGDRVRAALGPVGAGAVAVHGAVRGGAGADVLLATVGAGDGPARPHRVQPVRADGRGGDVLGRAVHQQEGAGLGRGHRRRGGQRGRGGGRVPVSGRDSVADGVLRARRAGHPGRVRDVRGAVRHRRRRPMRARRSTPRWPSATARCRARATRSRRRVRRHGECSRSSWSFPRAPGAVAARRSLPAAAARAGNGSRPLRARARRLGGVGWACAHRTLLGAHAGDAAGRGPAVRLRGRSRRLLGLQVVRGGLSRDERARGRRVVARRRAPPRGRRRRAGDAARHHRLPPLPGPRVHARVPGGRLREGPGDGHREAPRRPVLRVPVLHAGLSLRRPEVQRGQGHRAEVRHVQRPARGGGGPRVRAVVPGRSHPHPGRRRRSCGGGVGDEPLRGGSPRARHHAADDRLPDGAGPAAQHDPGRLLLGQPHGTPLAPHRDAGAHATVGRRVPRRAGAGLGGADGAHGRHPAAAQRQRPRVRPARPRGERPAPGAPAVRLQGGHRAASFVAEPGDRRVRDLRGAGRDVRRVAVGERAPRRRRRRGPRHGWDGPWPVSAWPASAAR